MTMFRRKADQIIDAAHNAICDAEMAAMHAYTDDSKQQALDDLRDAQGFLARAVAARTAWDAADHDDYEEYPAVARHAQETLI